MGASEAVLLIIGLVTLVTGVLGVTGVVGVREEATGVSGVAGTWVGCVAVSAARMAFATAFLALDEEASLLFVLDLGLDVGLGFSVAALTGDRELVEFADSSAFDSLEVTVRVGVGLGAGFGVKRPPYEFPNSWFLASLDEELGGG